MFEASQVDEAGNFAPFRGKENVKLRNTDTYPKFETF
jgi:hypothetical protein